MEVAAKVKRQDQTCANKVQQETCFPLHSSCTTKVLRSLYRDVFPGGIGLRPGKLQQCRAENNVPLGRTCGCDALLIGFSLNFR